MNKKYIVRLTDEERAICEATVKNEKGKSEKLRRAVILLKADMDGPGWNDEKISEAVGCRVRTTENVRREFVLEGFEAALVRKKRTTPPTPKLLDEAAEAKLIALRLGKPPTGWVIGRYDYSPTNWWNWRSWNQSVPKRSGRHSKKRHDQAKD